MGQSGEKQQEMTYFIFMRHGERVDQCASENANPSFNPKVASDPALSSKGQQQAELAGKYIKKVIKDQKSKGNAFDEVTILTSPFLRCLQTASRVSNALSKKTIVVDYALNEGVPQPNELGGDPFADLVLRNQEQLKKDPMLKRAKIIDSAVQGGMSPRSQSMSPRNSNNLAVSPRGGGAPLVSPRGMQLLNPTAGTMLQQQESKIDIIQNACMNRHREKKTGKNALYILVAHAPIVDLVFERFRAKAQNRQQFQIEDGFPGPCSSFEMFIAGDCQVSLVKGINDEYTQLLEHLQ